MKIERKGLFYLGLVASLFLADEANAQSPAAAPAAAPAQASEDAWSATIRSGMSDDGLRSRAELESAADLRRRARLVIYGGIGGGHFLEMPVPYSDDGPLLGTDAGCTVQTVGLDHVTMPQLAPGIGFRYGLSNTVELQARAMVAFGFGGKENVSGRCGGSGSTRTESTSVSMFAPALEATIRHRARSFYVGAGLRAALAMFFVDTPGFQKSGTSTGGFFQAVLEGGFVFGSQERFDIGLRVLPGLGTTQHFAGVHGEVVVGYALF